MARWGDLAEWAGPTPSQGPDMVEYRGLVLHIAEGYFGGTISWQRNPAARVSSHFIVAKDGRVAQMVDTATAAWTQASGNGHWLSAEFEGFSGQSLTEPQVAAAGRLYARGVREYGWPLVSTDSPSGSGLGWHGMGGVAWGNHPNCPGEPIKAQRPEILARAADPSLTQEVGMHLVRSGVVGDGSIYLCLGYPARSGKLACEAVYGAEWEAYRDALPTVQLPSGVSVGATGRYDLSGDVTPWSPSSGAGSLPAPVIEALDQAGKALAALVDLTRES